MKRFLILVFALFYAACAVAQSITYNVRQTSDWVFYAPQQPQIEVVASNTGETISPRLTLTVTTDDRRPLYTFTQQIVIQAKASATATFSFPVPAPGFYRCTLTGDNGEEIKRWNIGYEPTFITSPGDAQEDLRAFWDAALAELATVAPEFELTPLPEKSGKRNVYLVKMKSLGGEVIQGYYATPAKKGKYPVIVGFMGYGSKPWDLDANNTEFAEFVISVRGQGLNQPTNSYGDWITYGIENKEKYYYRGAFMDLIRAIDFVASRPELRQDAIFAEGGSQGGAFTLAACALDKRICAAAPYIPFLSDYPDYFRIVHWPAEPIFKRQHELNISDTDLYRTLSYFDIRNLTPWITCPVMMGVGLQDEVCPPHTNFSGYNRISAEKSYHIYPTCGHDVGAAWWAERTAFFKRQLR